MENKCFEQKQLVNAKDLINVFYGSSDKDYSKLIKTSKHPYLPLVSFCYTKECGQNPEIAEEWDNTTASCRGTIVDIEHGAIVSKAWNKFFNYNPSIHDFEINDKSYILEKLDGSLGITYYNYEKEIIQMASKNSFVSPMAIFGTNWIKQKVEKYGNIFNPYKYTYLFEIIYPDNRIVVPYNNIEECILLSIIDTDTGEELPFEEVEKYQKYDIIIPKKYNFKTTKELYNFAKKLPWNEEGYVLTLSDKKLKFKFKGDDYLKVFNIVYNTGTRAIWKMVKNGIDFDEIIKDLPNDLRKEKEDIYVNIIHDKKEVIQFCKDIFYSIYHLDMSRKDFAIKVSELKEHKKYSPGLFNLLDKRYDKLENFAIDFIEDRYKQKQNIEDEQL